MTMLFVSLPARRGPRRADRAGLVVGGQYRSRGWQRLEKAGVTGVVNLRAEYCDREAGIAPAGYLRLPTVDDEPPTMEQLREGVAFIDALVNGGGTVYVHCGAGVGRVATMGAAYLVAHGATPHEAWATLRAARPFIRPTPRQLEAVEQWCSLLGSEPYVTLADEPDFLIIPKARNTSPIAPATPATTVAQRRSR